MFDFHPDFETPESSTVIWRYMDFVALVWMLHHSSSWFSRADFFEDKWEDAFTVPNMKALRTMYTKKDVEAYSSHRAKLKRAILINCWYASKYESAAMWQLYAGKGNSIAIRSTVRRLADSVNVDSRKIHI